ncbi:MAG TPA: glycosyltransferase [Thermoanaerobaculia bacterium]|nr:glycosyltransferase [Thermoanaerobaculia bacterium]
MKADPDDGLRPRLYAWGRRTLPISWRRKVRRWMPVERLFGVRKPAVGQLPAVSAGQAAASGRAVVFLPVISWFYRWQRPQQLAAALARRGLRVFYAALKAATEPPQETADPCGVVLLPIRSVRWEDPPDRRLQGKALAAAEEAFERYRNRFRFHETALILETPFWEPLASRLSRRFGWKVVFDCLDDYTEFASNRATVLRDAQERLARSADLLVASSELLAENLSSASSGRRPLLIPNACDEAFAALPDPSPSPPGLRIGYAGAIEEWFDSVLVADLARRRPNWTIDLIGDPSEEVVESLKGIPNVFLRGEKPYSELATYMKEFDVVAIPHRLTPLTHAADHVKVYESLASGRGVVATPTRTLEPLAASGLVRVASTAAEFEKAILASAADGPETIARRRAFARENTWTHRAAALESAIAALFAASATASGA